MIATTSIPSVIHLNAQGVARRYGKSIRWVRELVRLRRIPHLKIGGAVLFPERTLEHWENAQTQTQFPAVTAIDENRNDGLKSASPAASILMIKDKGSSTTPRHGGI